MKKIKVEIIKESDILKEIEYLKSFIDGNVLDSDISYIINTPNGKIPVTFKEHFVYLKKHYLNLGYVLKKDV